MKKLLLIVMTWMSLFTANAFAQQVDPSTYPIYNPSPIKWWTRTGAGDSLHYASTPGAITDQFNQTVLDGQHGGWCVGCSLESVVWKQGDPNWGPHYELTCHSSTFNQSSYCGGVAPWPLWNCPGSTGSADPAATPDGCAPNYNKGCPSCSQPGGVQEHDTFGHPINPGTGNLYEIRTEYRGSGPFPLDFTWTYNSTGGPTTDVKADATLGYDRTDSYRRRIVTHAVGTATSAYVARPDGNVLRFDQSGTDWVPNSDIDGILTAAYDNNNIVIGWSYRNASNETEIFDATGRLLTITDSNGFVQTLTYNAGGHVATVTDPNGRQLVFGYNTSNRLITLTRPDGGVIQFGYDASDNLQTVTYPDTHLVTYLYNETAYVNSANQQPGLLTGEQDENGNRYATATYDGSGRATGTFLGTGMDSWSATYTDSGDGTYESSAVITSPLGMTRTLNLQPTGGRVLPTGFTESCTGCTTRTGAFGYNTSGHANSVTDAATVVTTYTVATNGLESQRVEAATTSNQRTIQTDWDTALRKPAERRTYDASGTTLVAKANWTYNTRGQVLTQTRTDPVTSATRTTTTSYCEQADVTAGTCPIIGLVKSLDGPRTDVTDVTTYTYYQTDDSSCASAPNTCPHRKGDLWKTTNALGKVTTLTAYDGVGRLLSLTDPNAVVTDTTYNARGWLTQRAVRGTNNSSTNDDVITGYTYDSAGQVTRLTQADASYTNFTYDAAHRLTDIADNLGDTIHYTLDAAGNRTQEDTKDPSAVLKRRIARTYNALGQLATTVNADGTTTNASYTYDVNGNTDLVTDGRSTVTDSDYDVLSRITATTQDKSTVSGHLNVPTLYAYDPLDQLTQVTDPQGLHTVYQYDGLGNLTQLTSPDTGITTYTYDSAGNRKTQTDARSVTTSYTYDALNRLTGTSYPDSTLNVSYGYDTVESNCPTSDTFAIGRMTHFNDGSGSTQFCFDRFGNLGRKVQYIIAAMYVVADHSFDKMGRPLELTEPQGTLVNYTRDSLGRINGVTYQLAGQSTASTLVSNVTYYPFGPVASITYGTGSSARTLNRTYDQDYVIGSVKDAGTDGLDLNYTRDAIGNLTQIANTAGTSGNNYAYDALNRLTSVKDLGNNALDAYSYDGTGNRTTKTVGGVVQTYTYYPNTTHHLYDVSGIGRTYDAAGNTLTIGTNAFSFVYDNTGRMSKVQFNNVQAKVYDYDARGERVRKTHSGYISETRKTIFDESGHILGDYDNANNIIDEVIWMDDLPIGVINGSSQTVDYVEPDHLGTPRTVIDPTRNLAVWKWSLVNDPFGEFSPNGDPDGDSTVYTLNLRFPGQEWDAESGLSYNFKRDYDSSIGRYMQSDPIGLRGGINTYSYALAAPINSFDSKGLISCKCSNVGPGYREMQPKPGAAFGDKKCPFSCMCRCPQEHAPASHFSIGILINVGSGDTATCLDQSFSIETASFFDRFLNPYTPSREDQDHIEKEAKKQCPNCDYWNK